MGKKREKALKPQNPALNTDHFRMYSFKVRVIKLFNLCASRSLSCSIHCVFLTHSPLSLQIDACPHIGEPHDINECPYLHPGERARRRNPRVFHYEALPCPDFRKSQCKRGDACPYGHGVFECWLHPSKYRTTLCKEGAACTRSVCFFAHSLEQLREPAANKSSTAAPTAHPQRIPLPPIVTTRGVSTFNSFSSPPCCDLNNPNSPGSILHQQCRSSCNSFSSNNSSSNGGHGAFCLSTNTISTTGLSRASSVDTSRCVSPGASIAAASTATMESLCQAAMSLPRSEESSLASTSEIFEENGTDIGFCLPASLDIDSENLPFSNKHTDEVGGCRDVAMGASAAAVALRARQQQAASAAAAAQVVLTRILQTAAENGLTVSQPQPQLQMQRSSSPAPPPSPCPSLSFTTSAVAKEDEQENMQKFALQEMMAGLGL